MCVEGIVEDLDDPDRRAKIATHQKAITMGILTEKHQLLTGGATSRVAALSEKPGHDDFLRAMQDAMGCGGEKALQKGAGVGPVDAVAGARRVTDVESRVLESEAPGGAQSPSPEAQKEGCTDDVSGT